MMQKPTVKLLTIFTWHRHVATDDHNQPDTGCIHYSITPTESLLLKYFQYNTRE